MARKVRTSICYSLHCKLFAICCGKQPYILLFRSSTRFSHLTIASDRAKNDVRQHTHVPRIFCASTTSFALISSYVISGYVINVSATREPHYGCWGTREPHYGCWGTSATWGGYPDAVVVDPSGYKKIIYEKVA